jgi:hypothetical protein
MARKPRWRPGGPPTVEFIDDSSLQKRGLKYFYFFGTFKTPFSACVGEALNMFAQSHNAMKLILSSANIH